MKFLVVTKTAVYSARRGRGSWKQFHCKVVKLDNNGEVVPGIITAFFDPLYDIAVRSGDVVETDAVIKGRALNIRKKSVCRVVGKMDITRLVAEETKKVSVTPNTDNSVRRLLDLGYISRPKMRHNVFNVVSKLEDKFVSIPVSIAAKHFGVEDVWAFAWPNGGFGSLSCMAEETNTTISVTDILDWMPDVVQLNSTVALRDITFYDNKISFIDNSTKTLVNIFQESLPFTTSEAINIIKDGLDGEIVLRYSAAYEAYGGYDKSMGGTWKKYRHAETTSPTEITIKDDILVKFNKFIFDREQETMWIRGVELIHRLIWQEQADINTLLDAVKQIIPGATKQDIINRVWDKEYNFEYFEMLSSISDEIHPYSDGFVMEFGNAAIFERPIKGSATYVFDRPVFDGGIRELMLVFNSLKLSTMKQGLRDDETRANVAGKIGLRGVVIHRDEKKWINKVIKTTFLCTARREPIIKSDIATFAALLGIEI